MEEAERIAREEHGSIKLAVISGKSSFYCNRFPHSRVARVQLLTKLPFTQVLEHEIIIGSWAMNWMAHI